MSKDQESFLYQQVINLIRDMKLNGTLRPGDKLPSLRNLSAKLEVSVPTVKQAYIELERQGLVEARPKSGYYLKALQAESARPTRHSMTSKPVLVRKQSLIEQVYEGVHRPDCIPLGLANPVMAHPSDKGLARTMRRVMSTGGAKVMSYGPMDGFAPLKRQLAMRYLDFGLQVAPEEITITNGAQEAIAIALQCVAQKGDVIAVESPCYFGILELIESLGMMALEIPVCSDDGIWLDDLEQALKTQNIKACVFSSSINNPVGSYMPDCRRKRLVNILEEHDVPLIEDDVYGDLYFTAQRGMPAQCFSEKGLVLTCASFSKTAAPGYRIGWILAGKYAPEVKRLKRALSCSSSLLNQWTLSEFIASGDYDRNMHRLRQVLLCNKERMIAQVQQHFPENTRVSDPKGGAVVWVQLPDGSDTAELFHLALKNKISIAPGAIFSPTCKFNHCTRLSYGLPWNERLEEAIAVLGQLAKEQLKKAQ
ncbi:aminotransferase class I/II-fold pyridoxal phosphate-dependent enzyme [Pleionea sp. CnH1-48]|uniref:aminotransferase-like domain-containing protein n=1 Tax=Pleionea sp. CnH1-48 TaxID=2954494 RepID=UPI00209780D1|nr:PLP-dependent aminotransferase family protein [Pleionea sp. CnH1-48]